MLTYIGQLRRSTPKHKQKDKGSRRYTRTPLCFPKGKHSLVFSQGKAQGSGREWECTNSFPPQLPSHAQPVSEGKFDGATSAFGISRVPFFVKPPPSLHLAYLPKGERQGGGRGGASPKKGISGHPKSGRRVVKLSIRNKSSRTYTAQPLRNTPKC